jgi:hypothetical protein
LAAGVCTSVWSSLLEEINHGHQSKRSLVFAYPIQRIDLKFSDAYWQPFIHLLPRTFIKAIFPDKNKHHASRRRWFCLDLSHSTNTILSMPKAPNDTRQSQRLYCENPLTASLFYWDDSKVTAIIAITVSQQQRFTATTSRYFQLSSLFSTNPIHCDGHASPTQSSLQFKFCPPPNLITDVLAARRRCGSSSGRMRPCPDNDSVNRGRHLALCRVSYYSNVRIGKNKNRNDESSDLLLSMCQQETLWVCLTCGCGLWSGLNKHAADHFVESQHPHSLELATRRYLIT